MSRCEQTLTTQRRTTHETRSHPSPRAHHPGRQRRLPRLHPLRRLGRGLLRPHLRHHLPGSGVTGLATFAGNFFSYSNTPSPVTVGLWNDQGQLLASAEVNNLTSTLYDGIWYGENIAPVNLAKDATYIMGTFVPVANAGSYAAGNAFWNSPYLLPLGGLASEPYQLGFYSVYGTDTALSLPTANVLGTYATANLLLGDAPTESVPEPGTYILCGTALLALGLHRRASVK